ncbi:MAG: NAD-dependent succinate-semialdehyde dehydrogenase [Deltaproteobacteria bacterium]|nr:NAD-dependent succinate-semialdehyde dehydrogenase [Deltaproteobacteria bacterium]
MLTSINPSSEEILKEYPQMTGKELRFAIDQSEKAFIAWKKSSFEERASVLLKIKDKLLKHQKELGLTITLEMGKPIRESYQEIEKCAWVCEYYAKHGKSFLKAKKIQSDIKESQVLYEPLGTILAIMPWNFPFWQVFRFLAPVLMAGNTALLKHASNVSASALAIQKIVQEAGLPLGVFQTLLLSIHQIKELIKAPSVKAVTLTGSSQAGRSVAALAGAYLKKCVLELGGSDPFIVLADADLHLAVKIAVQSRMNNSGQSCIAAKRFIIEEKVYPAFLKKMLSEMKAIKFDNPQKQSTRLGPLAKESIRRELHQQVETSVKMGAVLKLGGKLPKGRGYFYPPTVLTDIPEAAPLYREESFGPVASCFKVKNEEEALSLANQTSYGLGATLLTKNKEKALSLAKELEVGNCFINARVHSDPRLPFGGVKDSGFGRELSDFGIKEFTNIKTLYPKF